MTLSSPTTGGVLSSLGPYELGEVLGEGGMGVVYAATHRQTGEAVAVKTVKVWHEHQLAGIRREMLALSRLKHPGVVRVLATGLNEAVPWYAMELLEGETLGSLRNRGFGLSAERVHDQEAQTAGGWFTPSSTPSSAPDMPTFASHPVDEATTQVTPRRAVFGPAAGGRLMDVMTILRRLCTTLSFLHGEGVVHRDLKPSNIFVRPGLRPVLVDFGLVWRFGSGREVLDVGMAEAGTVGYMAPEQFRGELGDARADLYAVGCILYEMLTGRLPFEGRTMMEIRSGHLALSPAPPSHYVEGVPPELDQLVLGLLEKQPKMRVGHASDVEEVLERLGAEGDPSLQRPRAQAYVYRPALAGREQVMKRLSSLLERACGAAGSMILVGGESGIGKTYLAMAFARQAMGRGFAIVADSCVPPLANEGQVEAPLQPFRKLLQTIADRCLEIGPAATAMLLGENVHLLSAYEPSLAQLPGADAFPLPPELSAQAARERLIDTMVASIGALASLTPLLLIIDDLQWIDELSAQVLLRLDADTLRAKLLILGTYRSDERSRLLREIEAHPAATCLLLDRLDEGTVSSIVADMLAADLPPPALVRALHGRCRGNPFFVAEYLRAAVAAGLLTRSGGRWRIEDRSDEIDALPLPSTLEALVLHRLSGLHEGARRVLATASVMGKETPLSLVEQLAAMRSEEWLEALRELVQAQLIDEQASGALVFIHDKVRQVAYDTLDPVRRVALHLGAAQLLEQQPGADPRLLATHFLAGKDVVRGVHYLERAGEAALRTFSNREALDSFEQILALDRQMSAEQPSTWEQALASAPGTRPTLPPPAASGSPSSVSASRRASSLRRARWLRSMAEAHFALGDLDACRDECCRALQLLGFGPPTTRGGWALDFFRHAGSQLAHRLGRLTTSVDPWERASLAEAALLMQRLSERFYYHFDALPMLTASLASVNFAERADSNVRVARPYGMLGMTVGISKLHRLGRGYFHRARDLARRTDDLDGLAFTFYAEAGWRIGDGAWDEVTELSQQGLQIASARGNPQDAAVCKTLLAHVHYYHRGRFDLSRDLFGEIADEARRRNNGQHLAWGLYAGARARLALGDVEPARRMLSEAHTLLEPLADDASKIICSGLLASALAHLGEDARALETARLCSQRIRQTLPTVFSTLDGYAATAEVFLRQLERAPSPDLARATSRALFDLFTLSLNIAIGRPAYHRLRGRELWAQGHHRRARASWHKALSHARSLAMPYEEALASLHLGHSAPGSSLDRTRHLDAAARLLVRLGCPPSSSSLHAVR